MKSLSLRQQIMLMPILSAAAIILIAALSLTIVHAKIDAAHRIQIKSATEVAISVAGALQGEVAAGRLEEEQARLLARDALRAIRFAGNEYFYVYDYDGKLEVHPVKTELEGSYKLKDTVDVNGVHTITELIAAAKRGGDFVAFQWAKPGETTPSDKLGYAAGFAPWGWMVGTGVYVDDVAAETRAALLWIALAGLAALALSVAVGLWVARGIGRRVHHQSERLLELAEGALDRPVVADGGHDEVSQMAEALETLRRRLIDSRDLAATRAAEQDAHAQSALRIGALAREFDTTSGAALDVVAKAAVELESDAAGMARAAELTADRAVTVAAAAEQASSNVETVAAATEELTASIGEIARQVGSSARVALDASAEAGRTSEHVRGLAEAAQRIGAVVNLINDIAAQTNLLALNATIEAARAGEAGKGFAVVAGEVKHLANQTAKATDEIGEQIAAIQQASGVAVGAIESIAGIIDSIRDSTTTIAAAVEQQGAATREITRNVHEAAAGTGLVTRTIAEVTEAVSDTRRISRAVHDASGRLRRQCDQMRGEVGTFIAGVRQGS
ncbi:MAG: hypothetical protein RLZZ501_2299 [Pseudomonadota bacterium]|jgi:methyl-accepting chemotaxis protein